MIVIGYLVLIAMLRTAQPTIPTPSATLESRCTNAPDGGPPSIACGTMFVRLEGTILLKRASGSLVPGRRAIFKMDGRSVTPAIRVSRSGHFSTTVAVAVSDRVVCQGGKPVESRIVLPTSVVVSSQGCAPTTLAVVDTVSHSRIIL